MYVNGNKSKENICAKKTANPEMSQKVCEDVTHSQVDGLSLPRHPLLSILQLKPWDQDPWNPEKPTQKSWDGLCIWVREVTTEGLYTSCFRITSWKNICHGKRNPQLPSPVWKFGWYNFSRYHHCLSLNFLIDFFLLALEITGRRTIPLLWLIGKTLSKIKLATKP